MGFYPISSKSKSVTNARTYMIAASTVIEKGEMVKLSNGLVVAIGDQVQDDPYLGVAAEAHDGVTQDGRQTGTEILIWDDPDQTFAVLCKTLVTATGGSTTTFVDSNLKSSANDAWNGGKLWIVSHAGNSAYNNTRHNITDYTGNTDTITLGITLASAIQSGDTAYICPGVNYMRGHSEFNLNSDGTGMDWEASGAGKSIIIEGADPEKFLVFVRIKYHTFGNTDGAVGDEYVTDTELSTTLSDYVTSAALGTTLSDYVTSAALGTTLSDYVTSTALSTTLSDYVAESEFDDNFLLYLDDHYIAPETLEESTIRILCVRNRCNTASYDSVNGPVYTIFEIQAPDPSKDTPPAGTMHSSECTITTKIPEYGKFSDWSTMQYGDGTNTDDSAGTSINMQNRTGDEAQWNNIFFTGKKSGSTKRLMDIAYNGSIGIGGNWVIDDWGNDVAISTLQSALVLAKGYNTIGLNSNVYRKAGTTGFLHHTDDEDVAQIVLEDGVIYYRSASGTGKTTGDTITWGNVCQISPTTIGFFGQSGGQAAFVAEATDAASTQTLANAIRAFLIDVGMMASS